MIQITISYNLDDPKSARTFTCPDVEIARSVARGLLGSTLEQFSFCACGWILVRSNGRDTWHKDYLPCF